MGGSRLISFVAFAAGAGAAICGWPEAMEGSAGALAGPEETAGETTGAIDGSFGSVGGENRTSIFSAALPVA